MKKLVCLAILVMAMLPSPAYMIPILPPNFPPPPGAGGPQSPFNPGQGTLGGMDPMMMMLMMNGGGDDMMPLILMMMMQNQPQGQGPNNMMLPLMMMMGNKKCTKSDCKCKKFVWGYGEDNGPDKWGDHYKVKLKYRQCHE